MNFGTDDESPSTKTVTTLAVVSAKEPLRSTRDERKQYAHKGVTFLS
jgi:hypothetical protein